MKVIVDFGKCEANAICMGILPEVFEVDDDDNLHLLMDEVPEEMRDRLEQAVRSCPMTAISVTG